MPIDITMSFVEVNTAMSNEVLSVVKFLKDDILLSSYYNNNVELRSIVQEPDSLSAPVLANIVAPDVISCVQQTESNSILVGLNDGTLRYLDLENTKVSEPILQASDEGVGINFCKKIENNMIVASSYEGSIWLVDPRSPAKLFRYNTSGRIFALDTTSRYVTLGKSGQEVEIFDIRRLDSSLMVRLTGLRYQITSLKTFPDGEGYAIGSIDGRISIDAFNELQDASKRKFAFKCHRQKDSASGVDHVYPVTALTFHPKYDTLFTSGGDGHVCIWDWGRRKRVKQLPSAPAPHFISHMDLNHEGTCVVVGVTNDSFLRSQNGNAEKILSKIYCRELTESESKPKQ